MANRYGRKQKRAQRALLAGAERRAVEMARRYQQLLGGSEGEIRRRDEALRLLGTGYGRHLLDRVVEKATTEFMAKAMQELGRNGLAAMQVSLETRLFAGEQGRDTKVIRVLIPHAEFHAIVDEELARGR